MNAVLSEALGLITTQCHFGAAANTSYCFVAKVPSFISSICHLQCQKCELGRCHADMCSRDQALVLCNHFFTYLVQPSFSVHSITSASSPTWSQASHMKATKSILEECGGTAYISKNAAISEASSGTIPSWLPRLWIQSEIL
jgi:hypothetical protein